MNNYYEPPSTLAWDAYCDTTDEPTDEGFEAWMEEQYDRAIDAAIDRAEDERDFIDYGEEY